MVLFAGFLELEHKLRINLVMEMHMGNYGKFPWDFHGVQFTEQWAGHDFCMVLNRVHSTDCLHFLGKSAYLEGGIAIVS